MTDSAATNTVPVGGSQGTGAGELRQGRRLASPPELTPGGTHDGLPPAARPAGAEDAIAGGVACARPSPLVFANDGDVADLGRQVLRGTLPKPLWTHRAHLAFAAWIIAGAPGSAGAGDDPRPGVDSVPAIIRAYNVASGTANTDTGGYHDTITQASLRAVAHCLSGLPPGLPLHQACHALFASPFGDSNWLLAHWSRTVLFSAAARRHWVDPDVAPLPF